MEIIVLENISTPKTLSDSVWLIIQLEIKHTLNVRSLQLLGEE